MLTVTYFCVALCKLSSVQPSVESAHMAIGSNNNAGQCVVSGLNRSLFFICTHRGVKTMPVSLQKPYLEVEVGALAPDS